MAAMLTVRLTRGSDDQDLLTCVRADGTSTWGRVASFFPTHDLAHLAIESVLGLRDAFFGLISQGWDLADFSKPGAAARTPPEAVWVEAVVFALLMERTTGAVYSHEEFVEMVDEGFRVHGLDYTRDITAVELAAIRRVFSGLSEQWRALDPGETVEWSFTPGEATELAGD